jgi:predicted nucleic acid-binding protein
MIVCLDTNIVIYLVEVNAVRTPKATARLVSLRAAGDEVAVCDAARLECLTKPLATGNATDVATYRSFFASPLVRMLPVTPAIWERAALVGATYKLKPLDSVHLATAIEHGCGLFLTGDARLARCADIPVEVLT